MKSLGAITAIILYCTAMGLTGCYPSDRQDIAGLTKSSPASSASKHSGVLLPDALSQESSSFRWPEGKVAAVSLSFDDARASQVDRGLAILNAHDVKATFYVLPEPVRERLAGWKKAIANGHEIGNHTVRHPCSGNFLWSRKKALENYSLEDMGRELDEANGAVERLLGVKPTTFAYTCGQKFVGRGQNARSYVPLVAKRFVVGRGAFDEVANDPAFCDLAQATGISLDGLDFEQAKRLIEQAKAEGRWLIFFGHEVAESGRQTTRTSTLQAICRYAKDPASDIWIDTVREVGKYILQQRSGHDAKPMQK
jgi:peptidoglycan/xylan/chitin deacetylase (PgdA/CDA1 family)